MPKRVKKPKQPFDKFDLLEWKVNTPGLLKEVLSNQQTAILKLPINIFGKLLYAVGERASKINDPALNKLMCRLAIYEASDPYDSNYNTDLMQKVKDTPNNELATMAAEMYEALEIVVHKHTKTIKGIDNNCIERINDILKLAKPCK